MKAKIEKTLSARTRSRVVRAKRSTPKRSEERNERKTDRFRQKVDKKRRKDVHFFQNLHTFFSMPAHCAHRNGRNRRKRAALQREMGQRRPFSTHTSKEKPIIATKRRTKDLFIPNFGFTFTEAHQKNTLHLAISFPLRIHLSLPLPLCRALDRLPFAGFISNLFFTL